MIVVAFTQTPSPAVNMIIWSALVKEGHTLSSMFHSSLCEVLKGFMTVSTCYTISQPSLFLAFTEFVKVNTNLPIPVDKNQYLYCSERKPFASTDLHTEGHTYSFLFPYTHLFYSEAEKYLAEKKLFWIISFYNKGSLTSTQPGQSHWTTPCSV